MQYKSSNQRELNTLLQVVAIIMRFIVHAVCNAIQSYQDIPDRHVLMDVLQS